MFDQAMKTAIAMDKIPRHGDNSPWMDNERWPLLGVPLCVSDAVQVRGYDATCGLVEHCFKESSEDALLIKVCI